MHYWFYEPLFVYCSVNFFSSNRLVVRINLNFTHFLFIIAKLEIAGGDTGGFQFIFIKFLVFVLAFSNAISPLVWNLWNCIYVNMYFPFVQFPQINFIFQPVTKLTRCRIRDTLDIVLLCASRKNWGNPIFSIIYSVLLNGVIYRYFWPS